MVILSRWHHVVGKADSEGSGMLQIKALDVVVDMLNVIISDRWKYLERSNLSSSFATDRFVSNITNIWNMLEPPGWQYSNSI